MLEVKNQRLERLIDCLVVVGLLSGLATMLMYGHVLASNAFLDSNTVVATKMTISYKLLKIIEIVSIVGAGVLSYGTISRLAVPGYARTLMWILFSWALWQAFVAFKDGFTPAEPLGSKGPVVWWSLVFLFAGIQKTRWRIIKPVVIVIVFIACIDMVFGIVSLGDDFNRYNAVNTLRITLSLILWTAPLVFLVPQKTPLRTIIALLPLAFIGMGALLTATRSWFTIFFLYLIILFFQHLKTITSAVNRVIFVYFVIFLSSIIILSSYNTFNSQIQIATSIFSNRLKSDTRTKQLQLFFERVPLYDLLVGTGPRGTWRMNDSTYGSHYGYVDGPYLLMLFVGGVPLLLAYVSLVIYPSIKAFVRIKKLNTNYCDRACTTLGLFWALALTGFATYTFPMLYVSHYVILLCAGRCWGMLYKLK